MVQWNNSSVRLIRYPLVLDKRLAIMMKNVPTTFQSETIESFKERIKNGKGKTVKYTNYFAQLNVGGRVTISDKAPVTLRKKRVTKEERSAILLDLL